MCATHQLYALWEGIVLPVFFREALENATLTLTAPWRKSRREKGGRVRGGGGRGRNMFRAGLGNRGDWSESARGGEGVWVRGGEVS